MEKKKSMENREKIHEVGRKKKLKNECEKRA